MGTGLILVAAEPLVMTSKHVTGFVYKPSKNLSKAMCADVACAYFVLLKLLIAE